MGRSPSARRFVPCAPRSDTGGLPLWERHRECPGACPVLAPHDEIVLEGDADQAATAVRWLEKAMRDGMVSLLRPVPAEMEVRSSSSWGSRLPRHCPGDSR
jgi:hypothetical protein